ncbi:MAG: malate dehydrogenase [Desulfurococcaceae archaeon]
MISIIGVGRVGSITALLTLVRGIDHRIALVDIVPGLADGEALDLKHMCAILGIDAEIHSSTSYSIIEGSDIVLVTAGKPRKPGMTREELFLENAKTIVEIAEGIKKYAPESIVILTTNPVDPLTYVMYRKTGFSRERVLGFSGILDSARFSYYLSRKLGLSPSSITSLVIGMHGEAMLPLPNYTYLAGLPITNLLPWKEIEEAVRETKEAGALIAKLRGYTSSYAPAAGLTVMVETIRRGSNRVYSTSVVLKGEYGVYDVAAEVPVILGRGGIVKVIEIPLYESEKEQFMKSVDEVRRMINSIPVELR